MAGQEKIVSTIGTTPIKAPDDWVTIEVSSDGTQIEGWTSYEFRTVWTDACSSWHASIADGNYQHLFSKLQNGTKVVFKVNNRVQATGFVDRVEVSSSRTGGTIMTISGRDVLAPAIDSCISDNFNFDKDKKIVDILAAVLTPYGFGKGNIEVNPAVNKEKITGLSQQIVGLDDNYKQIKKIMDAPVNKRYRPHKGEGVYSFLARLGKRFGFHITVSADGQTLLCGQPSYAVSDPTTLPTITHNPIGTPGSQSNNVISSQVRYDWSEQPAVLVATNNGNGDAGRYAPVRCMLFNELLSQTDWKEMLDLREEYKKKTTFINRRSYVPLAPNVVELGSTDGSKFLTLVVVHDDESKDLNQLLHFARSEMCKYQSRFLTATYTVKGHSVPSAEGRPVTSDDPIWAPNTMVKVNDNVSGLYADMWIKSRTFRKDRHSGSTTTLELILPYTYELFPAGEGETTPTENATVKRANWEKTHSFDINGNPV